MGCENNGENSEESQAFLEAAVWSTGVGRGLTVGGAVVAAASLMLVNTNLSTPQFGMIVGGWLAASGFAYAAIAKRAYRRYSFPSDGPKPQRSDLG